MNPIIHIFDTKAGKLCPKYLEFIREQQCVICEKTPCDPHHVGLRDGTGGIGTKVPDFYTLPFCREHHRMFNAIDWGARRMADHFALNYEGLIIRHLSTFVTKLLRED